MDRRGEGTSAAKDSRLDFSRPLRMTSVGSPPACISVPLHIFLLKKKGATFILLTYFSFMMGY